MSFNPDSLKLKKPEIIQFLKETIEENGNNGVVKVVGRIVVSAVSMAPDLAIENLWNGVLNKFNALQIKNSMKQAELENPEFAKTFKKLEENKNEE